MHKKRLAIPIVLMALSLGFAAWFSLAERSGASDGRIEGSGTIEADELNVGAQVSAQITDIKVREGEQVKKGRVLVVLDDRLLSDQVAIAQAGVEAAQIELEDVDTANGRKIAGAKLKQARANLSTAKVQQGYAVVVSPTDGVVLSLPFSEGEVVSPGAILAVLGKTSQLELTIYVDEKELGTVKNGQKASVTVDAFPDETFGGSVTAIASEAEFTPQNVQTKEQRSNLVFAVTLRVENKEGKLKPGMPADAVLEDR